MNGNKRNFSLTIWDHSDNFVGILKSPNNDFEGQSYNENFTENIYGEKTLTFSVPMYVFSREIEKKEKNVEGVTTTTEIEKFVFKQNEVWKQIKNEQKIRYTEFNPLTSKPEKIEEFILKEFTESRNGEEKIADCTCESFVVYELGKVGLGITFDVDYILNYELEHTEEINGQSVIVNNCPDVLTLDYWMRKLLYKETNLGRVSNTTECTYLLQGLQLRDDEGYPIDKEYISDSSGNYLYKRVSEPICITTNSEEYRKYYNPTGWSWKIEANFENDPEKQGISTLYEAPQINKFIEVSPNYYVPQSYQKEIGTSDDTKQLRRHPILTTDLDSWTYVTDIKRRLINIERSNVFSIIQELCEKFEIWAYFEYKYNPINGKIDERNIVFKTESVDEEIKFDFTYGKNLQSCSRINNSNDLITKLVVQDTESSLVDGNLLSIRQATANPTAENYIYNFDYFYKDGQLTRENQFDPEDIVNSDEYRINTHCGKIRGINTRISNLQKYLLPLYNRQMELESLLVTQEGSETGYVDNLQTIQDKIDAIPKEDHILKSWSDDTAQYSHLGETKTFSTTTKNGIQFHYLNFGRDDVLVGALDTGTTTNIIRYHFNKEKEGNEQISSNGRLSFKSLYIPRSYKEGGTWSTVTKQEIPENDTTLNNLYYNKFSATTNTSSSTYCIYDYSDLGDHQFIKGIYFIDDRGSNARIRYKYAPLAYYYLLIKDYWDKLLDIRAKIDETKKYLLEINNKIKVYELEVKKVLNEKNELILQFEKEYSSFIKEGYWEPGNYESHLKTTVFDTSITTGSPFDKLYTKVVRLNTLNLNNSLSTYSKCVNLGNASVIKVNTISVMIPDTSLNNVLIPRLRGKDYELYLSNAGNLFVAIDPELSYKYDNYHSLYPNSQTTDYEKCVIEYTKTDGTSINTTKSWSEELVTHTVKDYYIYLSNDNILTDKLKVYGNNISENNLLELYTDYNYTYESLGYKYNTQTQTYEQVDLSKQESYSTDIQYDYSLKIQFELNDKTIQYFTAAETPRFLVEYGEETTLQYLYNDAVATSKKYSIPQVEYNISVIDLSSLNGYENYKPKLGQKVPINDPEMGFYNFDGFITSISYPLEQKYNTQIEISTFNTKFEDVFKKLTATMSDISYNSNSIYRAAESFDDDGLLKTDVFRKSLEDNFNRIQLGNDNDITIDKVTGITLFDNNSGSAVKLLGNGIFLSEDATKGDKTVWRTGITGEGINANELTVGNIDTKQISLWNSSENQIRFVWNDQGLTAYGDKLATSTDPLEGSVDYRKFVRFNQNGLNFVDNERSALSLSWSGLNIYAQNKALQLDANDGLILKDGNKVRLQLGKLDNGTLYGLRLIGANGITTFQSDNDGDLWLQRYIRIGGKITSENNVLEATAGIYGLSTGVPLEMQMGLRRDSNGNVIWDSTPIRFWAGPQNRNSYTTNIHINKQDIENSSFSTSISTKFNDNSITAGSPTLAKFKVSANGDIIASGIDVGGWIGEGDKLHSSDNEAILRSGTYGNDKNNPVIAIGKPSTKPDIISGTNYNLKIYNDGRINITSSSSTINDKGKTVTLYNMGINSATSPTSIVFYAGTTSKINESEFRVQANGQIIASRLSIGYNNIPGLSTDLNSISTSISTIIGDIISVSNIITDITNGSVLVANIGGYTNSTTGLTTKAGNYYVGIKAPLTSNNVVYYAGTTTTLDKNEFYVKADGTVKATKIQITGENLPKSTDKIINANDKFIVTRDGDLTASNAHIIGSITTSSGKIGNFTLKDALYTNSKTTFSSKTTGIYIGSDGISLGKDNAFKVTNAGELTVSGIEITNGSNFKVTKTGTLTANNGKIAGWTIDSSSLSSYSTKTSNTCYVGMKAPVKKTDIVFYAGTKGLDTNGNVLDTNEFWVTAEGKINASELSIGDLKDWDEKEQGIYDHYEGDDGLITSLSTSLSTVSTSVTKIVKGEILVATIGGYTNYKDGITTKAGNYWVGIKAPKTSNNVVYYAGTTSKLDKNEFNVKADGTVTATKIQITGENLLNDTDKIINANDKFIVTKNGDLTASNAHIIGSITTSSGKIGNFTISTALYTNSKETINTTTKDGVYIGSDGISLGKDNKFKVTSDGKVVAKDITINGTNSAITEGKVAGLTITSNKLYFTKSTTTYTDGITTNIVYEAGIYSNNLNTTNPVFRSGQISKTVTELVGTSISTSTISLTPNFYVTGKGVLYTKSAHIEGSISTASGYIAGWTIGSLNLYKSVSVTEKISNKDTKVTYYTGMKTISKSTDIAFYSGKASSAANTNSPFYVRADGLLKATNADITGKITATSGTIGNFTIGTALYTNGKSSKTIANSGIYIGNNAIALGLYNTTTKTNTFEVSSDGTLYAEKGYIAGWSLSTDSLYSNKSDKYYVGINKPSSPTDIVFYAGTKGLNANGKPLETNQFWVKANGDIQASNLTIEAGNIEISNIGGYAVSSSSLIATTTQNKINYYVGLRAPDKSTDVVYYAGTKNKIAELTQNPFYVKADGTVGASKIQITGDNLPDGAYLINAGSNNFTVTKDGTVTAKKIEIIGNSSNANDKIINTGSFSVTQGGTISASEGIIGGWTLNKNFLYKEMNNDANNSVVIYPRSSANKDYGVFYIGKRTNAGVAATTDTKFKISSDGSVFFKGGIYGWSGNTFKPGLSAGQVSLYTDNSQRITVEIVQGLIIDIR